MLSNYQRAHIRVIDPNTKVEAENKLKEFHTKNFLAALRGEQKIPLNQIKNEQKIVEKTKTHIEVPSVSTALNERNVAMELVANSITSTSIVIPKQSEQNIDVQEKCNEDEATSPVRVYKKIKYTPIKRFDKHGRSLIVYPKVRVSHGAFGNKSGSFKVAGGLAIVHYGDTQPLEMEVAEVHQEIAEPQQNNDAK